MEFRRQLGVGSHFLPDVGPARSQTWDKWVKCLFNISNQTWPQVLPTSLGVTWYGWHNLVPTLNFSSQEAGLSFPIQSRQFGYWALFVYTLPLLPCLPHPLSSSLALPSVLFPLFSPLSSCDWLGSCSLWTPPDVPAAGYALPFVYNKSSPPYLGADISSFFFISFIWHRNPGLEYMSSLLRTLASLNQAADPTKDHLFLLVPTIHQN